MSQIQPTPVWRYWPAVIVVLLVLSGRIDAQSNPANGQEFSEITAVPGLAHQSREVQAKLRQIFERQLNQRNELRQTARNSMTSWSAEAERTMNQDQQVRLHFQSGLAAITAQDWGQARRQFQIVTRLQPESSWAAEARLFLFDLALEQDQNFEQAAAYLQELQKWLEHAALDKPTAAVVIPATKSIPPGSLPLDSPGPEIPLPTAKVPLTERKPNSIAADIKLREALWANLSGEPGSAGNAAIQAVQLDSAVKSPLTILAMLKQSDRATVPAYRLDFGDQGKPHDQLMRLADTLQNGAAVYRAHQLWNLLLDGKTYPLSSSQKSYVHFRRAQCRYRFPSPLEKAPEEVIADYEQAVELNPTLPWVDECFFLAGNVAWNLRHDHQQAIRIWNRLLERKTDSPLRPRVACLIGVLYQNKEEWEQARIAFLRAEEMFPDSIYSESIRKRLQTVDRKLKRK